MFFLTFSSKCDDLILFLPLNSLEEVDGLLFKRFSIENIPEELVDDDSIFNDDDEAFETILQIFVLMYDPEENTFDNELSDDKNSKRIRTTSQSSSSWGENLETENQATPPPFSCYVVVLVKAQISADKAAVKIHSRD